VPFKKCKVRLSLGALVDKIEISLSALLMDGFQMPQRVTAIFEIFSIEWGSMIKKLLL
jgi:hypothetical protein